MTTELQPVASAPDLQGVMLPEVDSPLPVKVYTPGAGWLRHVTGSPMDEFGGISMRQLAGLAQHPEHPLMEQIEVQCHVHWPVVVNGRVSHHQQCPNRFTAARFFAPLMACDDCREKKIEEEQLRKMRAYWESVCPEGYRDTDMKHPDFPKAQYEATRQWQGNSSLLFYGHARTGKTRLAMLLMKRVLIHYGKTVFVIWAEMLADAKNARSQQELFQKWGAYDVILLDDSLLVGAQDEKVTAFLKGFLDYLMRHKRQIILTSQVGKADYQEQAKKYVRNGEEMTQADSKRLDALLGRVEEMCGNPVPFRKIVPAQGEQQF